MASTDPWNQFLRQIFLRAENLAKELYSGKMSKTVAASIAAALVLPLFILIAAKRCKKKQNKDRQRERLQVNCWFCNADSIISYHAKNEWDCRYCGQYNGFTEDGDYNKEVPGMYAATTDFGSRDLGIKSKGLNDLSESFDNGPRLCDPCNRMQILKVKQIAAFVPTVEGFFDYEVENYKRQLERTYKLCSSCERSLQRHLSEQDMQIREAYQDFKDIRRDILESDPERDEIEPKHKRKIHHKQPKSWNLLSLLWPSSILSVISFLMAWCLLVSMTKGIVKCSIYHFLRIGLIARALLWILNPFRKRKLLLLLLWSSLFVVTTIQRIFKYENIWLVLFIAICETWRYSWSLLWFLATVLSSCSTRVCKRIRNVKAAPATTNKKIPSNVPVRKKRKQVLQKDKTHNHSDNIRGKISTMSLGLTDSEDETSQPKNDSTNRGSKSWYAIASRFVTQPEDDLKTNISQNKRENQKFQLQPPRLLYPSLDNLFTNTSAAQTARSRNDTGGQFFRKNSAFGVRAERTAKNINFNSEGRRSAPADQSPSMNLDRYTWKEYSNDAMSEEREKDIAVLHRRNAPHTNEELRDSPGNDTGTDDRLATTREAGNSPIKCTLITVLKISLLVAFILSLVMNIYLLKR